MRKGNFIALLLCNLFLRAQQAYFYSKPPGGLVKAKIGENVTLNWNYTVEDGESALLMQLDYSKTRQFDRSAKRIAHNIQGTPHIQYGSAYKEKVHVARTGALTLYNVSVEQQGFYKFTLTLGAGSLSDKTQLFVGIPPAIRSFPAYEMRLLEDGHLDVTCEATGTPVPNVSWYKEIQYGWEKLSGQNLLIRNARITDSGLYTCGATNFMGSEEKTVKLVVYERPTVTSFFHTAALDDTIYECETITFTCEAGATSPPVKNIFIYHEGRLVHRSLNVGKAGTANRLLAVSSRTGRLRIASVRKEDEGRYYCVAENEHGLGYNKTINLKVFDAPKNCERKRTLTTAKTTARQSTSVSPTVSDYTTRTTKEHKVLGSHSHAQIASPSLFLMVVSICHFMFCSTSS